MVVIEQEALSAARSEQERWSQAYEDGLLRIQETRIALAQFECGVNEAEAEIKKLDRAIAILEGRDADGSEPEPQPADEFEDLTQRGGP